MSRTITEIYNEYSEKPYITTDWTQHIRAELIDYLCEEYHFFRTTAIKIEMWAFEQKHSYMGDYIFFVDEVGYFINTLRTTALEEEQNGSSTNSN